VIKLKIYQYRQITVNDPNQEKIMNSKKLITAAMTTAISTMLVTAAMAPVLASEQQSTVAKSETEQTKTEQDLVKVSTDASMTMRNVDDARLALFNGLPDKAQTYTDAAVTRAAATLKDADKYALDINALKQDGEKYVPFDASVIVSELLEPDKEKSEQIAKGDKQSNDSESQTTLESLKVDGIDVALTTDLLPIQTAKIYIEDAAKLIADNKYYEANLALKAVEDSVITEIINADDMNIGKTNS